MKTSTKTRKVERKWTETREAESKHGQRTDCRMKTKPENRETETENREAA